MLWCAAVSMQRLLIHHSTEKLESRVTRRSRRVSIDCFTLHPNDFAKTTFAAHWNHDTFRLLAVDEAHCVSSWGHDFRPDFTRLAEIRESLGQPTTIALTATATAECRRDIYAQLGISPEEIMLFHHGIDRPNLSLDVTPVYDEAEKLEAVKETLADKTYRGGSVIVYFSLIKTLERFSDHLWREGIDHVCYHGDLPRHRRVAVQRDFLIGQADIVLATPAFGMGIDKEDIRIVLHAETPGSIESYYQEIGRGVDRRGAEGGKRYAGGSCIVAPDGTNLVRCQGEDGIIRARLVPSRYAHLEGRLPYLRDLAAG